MNELKVIKIVFFNEYYKYRKYNAVIITIPNLETYGIQKESILNFQNRLCNELHYNLELKHIDKDSYNYKYHFRYDNYNYTINMTAIEEKINIILNTFPFRKNKRKLILDTISTKKQKIDY